ncbi:hypothetical protein BJV77DRAFT_1063852 [Russula vinacea]|nr:hypothetical protein BJV77DRAFT_1063852 [Russula vinacea]
MGYLASPLRNCPTSKWEGAQGCRLEADAFNAFPTRQGPDEFAVGVPPSRPPPTFRHIRKNSKLAQFLCIAGGPEKAGDVDAGDPQGLIMSPPILPMEADPFSGRPLGATIVVTGFPFLQSRRKQHTLQHRNIFSTNGVDAIPVVDARGPSRNSRACATCPRPHNTGDFHDTAARRAPRPRHRSDHAPVGAFASRSLSNPSPPSSVLGHYTSPSQPLQPSRVVNLESNSRRHGLIPTHTTHPGGTVAPLVVTHRGRHHQKMHDHLRAAAPNLRKARSSVVLSNNPLPPLHAPKPFNALERPSVETLRTLTESAKATASRSNVRNGAAAAHAVWPPAPMVRPPRTVNPERERDAYRTAAIEAEKTFRKISQERALVDHVRHEGGREARRRERDSETQRSRYHRRAATEAPKGANEK